jgi:hypothetical protein
MRNMANISFSFQNNPSPPEHKTNLNRSFY